MPTGRSYRLRLALLIVAILLPVAIYFLLPLVPAQSGPPALHEIPHAQFERSPLSLESFPLGAAGTSHSKITHVQILDLDGDGCPTFSRATPSGPASWYRQAPKGDVE